jgi:glycosyltransferase involved in cell wall biosynthesis
MARSAASQAPDVVHVFKPKAYGALAGEMLRLTRYLSGGPALVQDTDDWEGAGGWNEAEAYSAAERAVFAFQEMWGLRHADHVTSASRALVERTRGLGVAEDDVTYVPNAMDTRALVRMGEAVSERAARASRPGPPVIVLYTRFFEFPLARPLEVLARVRAVHPETRMLVAGEGLFGEHDGLTEEASRLELAGAIDHIGWVAPEALPKVLARADVAIYPFDDTLINRTKSPVKLLELMAAGLPVVAERIGEPAVVIEDGVSGRLVAPLDVPAFAAEVCALLADPTARATEGDAARRRVVEQFAWDRLVLDLEAAYARAMSRRAMA